MSRSTLLNGSGAPLAQAIDPQLEVASLTSFDTIQKPDILTLQTAHGHMAAIMREVLKAEDATASKLFNEGMVLPPEARAGAEAMRDALALYDSARAAAEAAPVPAMLRQAVGKLDEALEVGFDDDDAAMHRRIGEARALTATAILALEYQPPAPDAPK